MNSVPSRRSGHNSRTSWPGLKKRSRMRCKESDMPVARVRHRDRASRGHRARVKGTRWEVNNDGVFEIFGVGACQYSEIPQVLCVFSYQAGLSLLYWQQQGTDFLKPALGVQAELQCRLDKPLQSLTWICSRQTKFCETKGLNVYKAVIGESMPCYGVCWLSLRLQW